MKRLTIVFFSLFLINLVFAQEQAIKITKETSKKEIIIKENKRIKIKTTSDSKISGRFSIDGSSLVFKKQRVELADIIEIRRNPLWANILTGAGSVAFVYVGAITVGIGVIGGVLADSTFYWITVPGAALITLGAFPPNFNRKFGKSKWAYELISIP